MNLSMNMQPGGMNGSGGLYPGQGGMGMGMGMGGMGLGQGVYAGSTPNLGVFNPGVPGAMPMSMITNQLGPAAGGGYGAAGTYGMMGNPQGQIDMVERWRQGVMP